MDRELRLVNMLDMLYAVVVVIAGILSRSCLHVLTSILLPDSIQTFSHCWFRKLAAAPKLRLFHIFPVNYKVGRTTLKNDLQ